MDVRGGKDTDVIVKRKDGKAENEEKQKSNRGIRVWGERCEEAHSSTTLHYVRHFREDSLGSENREDVGKGRCGEVHGDARGRPNKYLTKSSGKLIPSLGRLLRDAPSVAAPSTKRRARASRRTARFRYFARAIPRCGSAECWNHAPTKRWRAWKILKRYWN